MCYKFFLVFIFLIDFITSELPHHLRHEYKYTFKAPSILPKDQSEIPFFETGGHVIANPSAVRLTTSLPNQQGWIWTKNATENFFGFQIDILFRITGRGRVGADGLAVWIVKEKSYGGQAFGASDKWNGLGVFIDTYDNKGEGESPLIHAILNDGTKTYNHENDGRDLSLGHCIREIRNRPHPIYLRLVLLKNMLTISLSPGLSKEFDQATILERCFSANIQLPRSNYYLGISSATGALADDHDVEKFEVHSFIDHQPTSNELDEEKKEQKKYEEEFQKNLNAVLEEPKSEKGKPEKTGPQDPDSMINQNLMIIWEELTKQNKHIQEIQTSLEKVAQPSNDPKEMSVKEHIDGLRKELLGIKQSVDVVGSNKGDSYQNHEQFQNIHNSIDGFREELNNLNTKVTKLDQSVQQANQNSNIECSSNGVSSTFLIFVVFIQLIILIGFSMFQKHRENQSKKFY